MFQILNYNIKLEDSGNITTKINRDLLYTLDMDIIYNKCWCCLRSDYISLILKKLSLPLNMTLHLIRGRWWTIICPPSGILSLQEIMYLRRGTYPTSSINLYSVVHQVATGALSKSSSQRFTWYGHQSRGITLVALWLLLIVWHPPVDRGYMYVTICCLIG